MARKEIQINLAMNDVNLIKLYFKTTFKSLKIIQKNISKLRKNHCNQEVIETLLAKTHLLRGDSLQIGEVTISDLAAQIHDLIEKTQEQGKDFDESIVEEISNFFRILKKAFYHFSKKYMEEEFNKKILQLMEEE